VRSDATAGKAAPATIVANTAEENLLREEARVAVIRPFPEPPQTTASFAFEGAVSVPLMAAI
jgi:hypothetical protein